MKEVLKEDLKVISKKTGNILKVITEPFLDFLKEKKEEMKEDNKIYKTELRRLKKEKIKEKAYTKVYGKEESNIVPNNLESPLLKGDLYGK